jgi:DNA-binding HxlR family transcriptional regulator
MNPTRQKILQIIAKNDGRFGWYNLEIRLSVAALNDFKLMTHIKELQEGGLIRVEAPPDQHPRYWITDAGRAAIESPQPNDPSGGT